MDSEEDVFDRFRKILEYSGLARNKNSNNERLFRFLAYFLPFLITTYFVLFLLYILEDHRITYKLESLQCIVSLTHLMTKIINLRFRKEKYKALLNDTMSVWRELRMVQENVPILMETRKNIDNGIKLIMGIYMMTPFITCAMAFLKNVNLQPEDWEFPFKIWDPISIILGKGYYFSKVIFQLQCFIHALFIFGVVYCAYIIPCMMAIGQMKVLGRMMSGEGIDIQECIRLHQKNIKLVKDIKEMMCGQMFIEIVLSALHISFRCYQIMLLLKNYDGYLIGSVFFLSLSFCGPYCVCLCGQMITDAKEKLFRDMYQSDWYNLSIKDSKDLRIMVFCASKNLDLEYRHIMVFNMERLTMVLQTTYSYIMILIKYT